MDQNYSKLIREVTNKFLNKIDITTLEDGDTIYDKIINNN